MEQTILLLLRKHSPNGAAPPEQGNARPITAHYSFIDLERIKG